MRFRLKIFALLTLLALILSCCAFEDGCTSEAPSDKTQRQAQEKITQEGNAQVGMPGITNFTEKKIVRKLYELRDQNIVTYTYVPDFQGRLWHVCDSIGYGLPYGTQFSNPDKVVWPEYHDWLSLHARELRDSLVRKPWRAG